MSVDQRAKQYSTIKYSLALFDTFYLLLILFLFVGLGTSKLLAAALSRFITGRLFLIPLYFLLISVLYYLLSFPVTIMRSYVVERFFLLTNQSLSNWFKDQVKSGAVSYTIGLVFLAAFYVILDIFPDDWWLVISAFWVFFSVVLAKILPVLIIPLFFKYTKLDDEALRQRIMALAERMKVKILDIFQIDFSKKTLKGNAAFVGVGSTKRVILADTLKDKYTPDEIEAILAHEFAHYKLRHLLKLIAANSFITLLLFYLIFMTNNSVLRVFGLASLSDVAALPVIFIYFTVFGLIMQPLEAFISRCFERQADMESLKATGSKDAFISMMEKLAEQNLADRSPHPLIKFFFFDHPPIDERIKMAKEQ